MRVVFLGNHTVGVNALKAIAETEDVVGVVAHPLDSEDGVRYQSVYDYAVQQGWDVIRSTGKNPDLALFIRTAKPDLLWVTDYRFLLPSAVLSLAPLGAVNLHPSLLPQYRGRAPLNWAILSGECTLGLTAHFIDEGVDTGDIIAQIHFDLHDEQDVGDALHILYPLYKTITQQVLTCFRNNQIARVVQDHALATVFPARKPNDGLIDWTQSAEQVRNLIRAVTRPYPGAFSYHKKQKINLWRAELDIENYKAVPGQVVRIEQNRKMFWVKCNEGVLCVTDFTIEQQTGTSFSLQVDDLLMSSTLV